MILFAVGGQCSAPRDQRVSAALGVNAKHFCGLLHVLGQNQQKRRKFCQIAQSLDMWRVDAIHIAVVHVWTKFRDRAVRSRGAGRVAMDPTPRCGWGGRGYFPAIPVIYPTDTFYLLIFPPTRHGNPVQQNSGSPCRPEKAPRKGRKEQNLSFGVTRQAETR